jgi:hypothetical protein
MILGFRFSPDFNGDRKVDIEDLIRLIEHWGQDEPSVDIVPAPFGDGIVDRADLEVLLAYWGQEINDPTLLAPWAIAHWALDETVGNIASDSAGKLDGTVHGEALWQPEAGMVGGALEFDGIDDYVSIPSFMLTANSSLSVFAWIKGGMPGQVIISQKDRVGLVWDGSNRILYVDDVEVVSDTYDKGRLFGRLQIGAGMNLDPGTFWSGLIDDVRIYNRAVSP